MEDTIEVTNKEGGGWARPGEDGGWQREDLCDEHCLLEHEC